MKRLLNGIFCLPAPAWAIQADDINMVWLATASALVFLIVLSNSY